MICVTFSDDPKRERKGDSMRRWHDDDEEHEDWQDEDDDNDGYLPCPHCGEIMLEDAEYCAACDRWMTNEDSPQKRKPWWVVVVILIVLATLVMSVVRF